MEQNDSITICVTIGNPADMAADQFLWNMIDSPGLLAALIRDAIIGRYQEAAIRAGMVYSWNPYDMAWDVRAGGE